MAKSKSTALISVEELERQMAPLMKTAAATQVAAEPVYSSANIIRTKNKKFANGDNVIKGPLEVVILGSSFIQAYYEDAYDADNKSSPVCFALAPAEIQLAAHETSPKKQHDGPCATCPQNKPGTGAKGGWTRACQGRRRVAFLFLDDKTADPAICTVEVSAGGLRAFSAYTKSVAAIQGAPLYLVGTALDFVDTKKETWYVGPSFVDLLSRIRPEWLHPGKGVKLGSEGWLDTTMIGRKVREVSETKLLLAPPQIMAPGDAKPAKSKPVTGARRVAVKDLKKKRRNAA